MIVWEIKLVINLTQQHLAGLLLLINIDLQQLQVLNLIAIKSMDH
jgi:hypothetical protein